MWGFVYYANIDITLCPLCVKNHLNQAIYLIYTFSQLKEISGLSQQYFDDGGHQYYELRGLGHPGATLSSFR